MIKGERGHRIRRLAEDNEAYLVVRASPDKVAYHLLDGIDTSHAPAIGVQKVWGLHRLRNV